MQPTVKKPSVPRWSILGLPPGSPAAAMQALLRVVLLAIAAYSSILILVWIAKYGVNIPFWDDWNFIRIWRAVSLGQPVSSLLLMHSGEHRDGLLALIHIGLWDLTGPNYRAVMFLDWLVVVFVVGLAASISVKAESYKSLTPWIALASASFFLFNPAAYQLWVWDMVSPYLLVSSIFLVGAHTAQCRVSLRFKIIAISVCSFLSCFILGSGILLWILLYWILLRSETLESIRQCRIALGISALLFAVSAFSYAALYWSGKTAVPMPPGDPSQGLLYQVAFFLAYTGDLVSLSSTVTPVGWAEAVGALICVLFVLSAWICWRFEGRSEVRIAALIWFCLGVYQLLGGIAVAHGRYMFGLSYPVVGASRYVLAAAWLPVCCVPLAAYAIGALKKHLPKQLVLCSAVLMLSGGLVFVSAVTRVLQTPTAEEVVKGMRLERLEGTVAVMSASALKSPLPQYRKLFSYDSVSEFKSSVEFLGNKHLLRPGLWDSAFVRRLAESRPRAGEETRFGTLNYVHVLPDRLQLAGWAFLPDRRERADAVIVTIQPPGQESRIVGVAFPESPRPDIAAVRGPATMNIGWATDIGAEALTPSRFLIRCFAYDVESGAAYPLDGATMAEGPGLVLVGSHRAKADFELTANPDAAAWKNVEGVFAERAPQGDAVPGHRTEIRSRWTEKNLYFLFICPYEQLFLKENPSTTTETNLLWMWDIAEVLVGTDFNHIGHYREYQVSPQGEWVDVDVDLDRSQSENWLWNSGMRVKARLDKEKKVWYGEMRIPIANVDSRLPAPGNEMRINFCRIQGPPPHRRFIVWQPTHSASFHVPEAFGKLQLLD